MVLQQTDIQDHKPSTFQKLGMVLAQTGLLVTGMILPSGPAMAGPVHQQQINQADTTRPIIVDKRGNPDDLKQKGPEGAGRGFDRTAAEIEDDHKDQINHYMKIMPEIMHRLVHKSTNTFPGSELDQQNYDLSNLKIEVVSSPLINAEMGIQPEKNAILAYQKKPQMYITTGLLAAMPDEDTLAAVMSHEWEHYLVRQRKHYLNNGVITYTDGSILTDRMDEKNADLSTILRLSEAGYRPGAALGIFRTMIDIYGDKHAECSNSISPSQDPTEPCDYISPYRDNDPHGTHTFRASNLLWALDGFCQQNEASASPKQYTCPDETKQGLRAWRDVRDQDRQTPWAYKGTWKFISGSGGGDQSPRRPLPKM